MDKVRVIASLLFLIVWYKVLINHIRVVRLRSLLKFYKKHIIGNAEQISERENEIIGFFRRAKLEEPVKPSAIPMGFGYVQPQNLLVWQNMHLNDDFVIVAVEVSFHKAIGYYRQRRNEALSPQYWIEFALFAPRNLLSYIGFDGNSAAVKAFQAIAWIVELAAAIVAIVEFMK